MENNKELKDLDRSRNSSRLRKEAEQQNTLRSDIGVNIQPVVMTTDSAVDGAKITDFENTKSLMIKQYPNIVMQQQQKQEFKRKNGYQWPINCLQICCLLLCVINLVYFYVVTIWQFSDFEIIIGVIFGILTILSVGSAHQVQKIDTEDRII